VTDDQPMHMSPDEFRRAGGAILEWVARYLERIEDYPVLARSEPGEIRGKLPAAAPLEGEPWEQIIADLDRIVVPGLTHWQSPGFFAYFPANASPPAILGDLVSAGLGVQGMLWTSSPSCTELEAHVLDWLVDMLHLPPSFKSTARGGGVIQDTASSATLCALLAARERASGYAVNESGVDRRLIVYGSTQAHSSLEKAVAVAGIGRQNLRLIDTDEHYAMRPERLADAIAADAAAGSTPCMVCATVGTTSSTAIDPVGAIGAICREHGVWLHVDAALAGNAAVCPEFHWLHDGVDRADSYCFNPHKWLLTNFDCDCFYVADRATLIRTLSVLPEYLRNKATESGAVFDYRDWHVPLGRRFRSLKLWFVIRHYGIEGLRRHIRRHVALAREFAEWVAADPEFEIAAPAPLNLVCFRHRGSDAFNRRLLETVNASGSVFLTHTMLHDRFVLRLATGGTYTERRHVERAWHLLRTSAAALQVED
jgi:aromatic-L-amino-acid decarboxylase